MNPTEPSTGLETGVWFENKDFYRYRGRLPIVVQGETIGTPQKTSSILLQGCISCQLPCTRDIKTKRWMILPP